MAAGIERALAERELLVRRGFDHTRGFTWRRTGEIMLRAYEEAAA
jgi:hypothetical protein